MKVRLLPGLKEGASRHGGIRKRFDQASASGCADDLETMYVDSAGTAQLAATQDGNTAAKKYVEGTQ